MIRSFLLTCVLISWIGSGVAIGDELDQQFPANTPATLIQNARQMIHNGMPPEQIIQLTRAMQQNQFSVKETQQAQEIIMRAQKKGLDADAVMNKAFEGMTKRVPDEMVVKAMEKVYQREVYAFEKAEQLSPDSARIRSMHRLIAAGMSAGIEKPDMDQTVDRLKVRNKTVADGDCTEEALKTLRDMARLGANSHSAAEVVGLALEKNYNAEQMKQLRHEFARHSMNGNAEGWAQSYSWSFKHGQDMDEVTAPGQQNGFGSQMGNGSGSGNGSGGSNGSGGPSNSGGGSGGSGNSGGSGHSGGGRR